jgi:ubiquitin C-terminal hydrolase
MFGLQNYGGSCWLNACLQSILRLPEIKARYSGDLVPINSIDESLQKIWKTQSEGLKDLFGAINSDPNAAYEMLAGRNIGDSNEALVYFCDKLPFLDELCRYHIVELIQCKCGFTQERKDSHIQFELYPTRNSVLTQCISNVVKSEILDTWKCDKCSERGSASKQILMKSFPKYLVFKLITASKVQYSTILVINSIRYELLSVTSFNGAHWWAYSKDPQWVMYDDTRVRQLRPNESPSSSTAKMLIYYRLN